MNGRNLANGQNIIDIKTLEQRPHSEINIDQAASKIKSAGEAGYDLETGLAAFVLGACIQLDDIPGARSRMSQDLGDLERMGLDVFREAGPREGEIISHEVVHRVT
jgi:hypothetical protein